MAQTFFDTSRVPDVHLEFSEVAQVLGTSAEYKVSEVADRNADTVLRINRERLQPLTLAK